MQGERHSPPTSTPGAPIIHEWGITDPPTTEGSLATGPPHPTRCPDSLQTARRGQEQGSVLGSVPC